jgi:predicted flap endonuclease-1-like 5' DNA nuclease
MEHNHGSFLTRLGALVALLLGFVAGLVIALVYLSRRPQEGEVVDVEALPIEELARAAGSVALATSTPQSQLEPDDLKRVEGIGPKISAVLQEAGIVTFEQLAASHVDQLARILREEDPRLARLADPTTWPEQAALAALGAWDTLEELQEELTAGRRA